MSILGAAAFGLALSAPALAANDAMLELLKVLRDKGTIDQDAYDQIVNAARADEESNTADKAQVEQAAATLPKIETKGKLEIGTPDGEFNWRIGGRIHADTAFYSNDDGIDTTKGAPTTTKLAEGSEFRRARLDMTATVWRTWQFKFQYDFTNSGVGGIRDAYIRYLFKGYQPGHITVGNFKAPFSLEELTSSNNDTFMEQSLASVFVPSRKIGIMGSTWGHDMWTLSGGIFSEGVAPVGDQPGCSATIDAGKGDITTCTGDADEGYAGNVRFTFSPIHTQSSDQVIHLGFGGEWRSPDDRDVIRFRAKPESNLADRLVDTGNLANVDYYGLYGAEVAGNYGPFSAQGEYYYMDVNAGDNGLGVEGINGIAGFEPSFNGWYALASYVLTGESRPYKFEEGVFENPKPFGIVGKGGIGAWELAVRYSSIDLNDDFNGVRAINGGEQDDVSVGVNWYPTPNLKFMANYVKVLDIQGGKFEGAEPDVFQFRAQAYW
jgi:phosphate-selective porin OprO/OprP